eukprot:TRINITY_DN2178_c3_g2_i1.p1 TRINITY_DN2178_c3_g2~~TRINITY_DN2178_c3_g2_i1.p1  ORF type:complete len:406 (+),score=133.08 TRINITY_DN2178_c3_g2_i1:28-1218(+)
MSRDLPTLQKELTELDPRYKLEKVIGAGSYGVVLKAKELIGKEEEPCAVKKVSKEIFGDMILAKRILREIKLLGHFHNDNIVALRNLITPTTREFKEFFIVMDLMETDLKSVFKSGQKMTNAHVQYFLYQILRALKHIHAAGVIHRDITPANILVNINCDLKICDFGLARDEPKEDDQYLTDYVTMRWYRAPELVMESKTYTGAVDMWGVGAIMSEMFGSKPLFPGKDRVNQLDKILDVIGTPPDNEIKSVGSEAAQRYVKKKGVKKAIDFVARFPNADPVGIALMTKMLAFHPAKRITVEKALEHPYLTELHDEEDEDVSGVRLFDFDDSAFKSAADVKAAIYEETLAFHRRNPTTLPPRLRQAMLNKPIKPTGGEHRSGAGTLVKNDIDDVGFT